MKSLHFFENHPFHIYFFLPFQDKKVKGRKADAILAAHLASEVALRLVKPGNEVSNHVIVLNFVCLVHTVLLV
jgi:hypothetical protein